ncbi:hypothetical protein BASA83_011159 [Batrachochytrium salamandrivorans]|nr:hypothetical protein BASA83_011159 [Batrachochytrium salamandrivorans]
MNERPSRPKGPSDTQILADFLRNTSPPSPQSSSTQQPNLRLDPSSAKKKAKRQTGGSSFFNWGRKKSIQSPTTNDADTAKSQSPARSLASSQSSQAIQPPPSSLPQSPSLALTPLQQQQLYIQSHQPSQQQQSMMYPPQLRSGSGSGSISGAGAATATPSLPLDPRYAVPPSDAGYLPSDEYGGETPANGYSNSSATFPQSNPPQMGSTLAPANTAAFPSKPSAS